MKPIELLVVDSSPRDILLTRLALAHELYPINILIASDGRQACALLTDRRRPRSCDSGRESPESICVVGPGMRGSIRACRSLHFVTRLSELACRG